MWLGLSFLIQDYPSLSQINRAVKENKINLIFAVTEDQFPTYDRLSKYIEGSIAGKLANDSSNVVELVKDQYNVWTQTKFPEMHKILSKKVLHSRAVFIFLENLFLYRAERQRSNGYRENHLFLQMSGHQNWAD